MKAKRPLEFLSIRAGLPVADPVAVEAKLQYRLKNPELRYPKLRSAAEGLELLLGAELVAVPALLLAAVHSPGLQPHLRVAASRLSNPESVLLLQVTCTRTWLL